MFPTHIVGGLLLGMPVEVDHLAVVPPTVPLLKSKMMRIGIGNMK